MADLFRTIIVTAADAPLARQIAAGFGPGGSGMWNTPLSQSGNNPESHNIISGYIPAEFVGLAPCTTYAMDEDGNWTQTDHYPGDAVTVHAYATQAGVQCTLAQVEGLFTRADSTAQEPFVAMGRLGLKIINPPLDTTTRT